MRWLTENQQEVMLNLMPTGQGGWEQREWLRPMDLGGCDGSHHSGTLARLEKRGLVESKRRGWQDRGRGSKVYRVTEEGWRLVRPAPEGAEQ